MLLSRLLSLLEHLIKILLKILTAADLFHLIKSPLYFSLTSIHSSEWSII